MSKSGRRNPPEHSRFKKGVSGNPKGRPPKRRKRQLVGEIVSEVQNTPTAYREDGRTKLATRFELLLKKLVNAALGGDPKSADDLFRLRTQAERNNGAKMEKIIVEDWVPDFPGQTGEQKTRAHGRENEIDPTGSWEQTGSSNPPGSVAASPKPPPDPRAAATGCTLACNRISRSPELNEAPISS
jgi:hypothetical protein